MAQPLLAETLSLDSIRQSHFLELSHVRRGEILSSFRFVVLGNLCCVSIFWLLVGVWSRS